MNRIAGRSILLETSTIEPFSGSQRQEEDTMGKVFAVAGKGGTGKTTVCALMVRHLLKTGQKPILAVDADPNSSLGESLGIDITTTIGDMREDFFQNKASVPSGMSKENYLDMQLQQAVLESSGFDMIVMGRQEGSGCYCFINNVTRKYTEELAGNYKNVVIDNEAGMEHLSRRTAHKVDSLWLVTDYALRGLRAVERIKILAKSLDLKVKEMGLIVNRAPETLDPAFVQEMEKIGLPLLGTIPPDPALSEFDLAQRSLLELPDDSPAILAMNSIIQKTEKAE